MFIHIYWNEVFNVLFSYGYRFLITLNASRENSVGFEWNKAMYFSQHIIEGIRFQEDDFYRKLTLKKPAIFCDDNSILALCDAYKIDWFDLFSVICIITKYSEPFCQRTQHSIHGESNVSMHKVTFNTSKKLSKKLYLIISLAAKAVYEKKLLLTMKNYTVGFYSGIRMPSLGLISLAGNVDE